jgi:purine-nucleoside/S-methyl-5'-thioadenosine phosphorylase / adenosine deaminase
MSGAGPGLLLPDWPAPAGVRAAFTLRTGGVSAAPYDSLNMGAAIGDSPEAVAENRRLVSEALRFPREPGWLEQVHGTHVVVLDSGPDVGGRARNGGGSAAAAVPSGGGGAVPKGDASVAWGPGRVCAIRVADCMPVLFAARDGSAVGAAHAGWRGLAGGVLEATVERLGIPASQLIAWMGPAIGQANFEVGDDVRTAFMATDPDAASAFVPNARGRWQCDLYALARRRLAAIGVAGVFGGGWCTFADSERFFSFRRNAQTGRMAALIWIES